MDKNQKESELHPVSSRLYGVNQRLELIRNLHDAIPHGTEDGAAQITAAGDNKDTVDSEARRDKGSDQGSIKALERTLDIRMRGYIAGLNGDLRRGRGKILDWVNGLRPAPGFDFDEVNYRRLRKQAKQVRDAAERARREIGRLNFTGHATAGDGEEVGAGS